MIIMIQQSQIIMNKIQESIMIKKDEKVNKRVGNEKSRIE
jgi:hypothetical protein